MKCTDQSDTIVLIESAGIPSHPIGAFPFLDDTNGDGVDDVPYAVLPQSHEILIPRHPQIRPLDELVSILTDRTALPQMIGVALNGVPFFSHLDENGEDTCDCTGQGFQVLDGCSGRPDSKGVYHYRSTPWCMVGDTPKDQETKDTALKVNTECAPTLNLSIASFNGNAKLAPGRVGAHAMKMALPGDRVTSQSAVGLTGDAVVSMSAWIKWKGDRHLWNLMTPALGAASTFTTSETPAAGSADNLKDAIGINSEAEYASRCVVMPHCNDKSCLSYVEVDHQ